MDDRERLRTRTKSWTLSLAIKLLLFNHCLQLGEATCYSENVDQPIVEKPGDYMIAGIFNIGSLREVNDP